MSNASTLENVYHEILMRNCKGDEEKEWEQLRHEVLSQAINENENKHEQDKEHGRY